MLVPEVVSTPGVQWPSRTHRIRFVFIDASVYYVDKRGEHSGILSEAADTQEERSRLMTVSNNKWWLRAAVALGDELIDLGRRSGDSSAWGCTSGHFGGGNPGPNVMAQVIREVTGLRPPKPASGPFARPEQGRWSVRQVFAYDNGEAPNVAIWHLGFSENPKFFPRWCEAISAGPGSSVLILPDSPITRDLVRRWNAGERYRRGEGWRGDAIRGDLGSAAYVRPRVSDAVEVGGLGIPGDRLVAAVAFLRARHQLRLSPFDLLRDSVLAAQLGPVELDERDWSPGEVAKLATLRQRYDLPQRIHRWLAEARQTPPVGVFSTGESYASSVESCLHTAEQAIKTGAIAPVLISSWTGWAPSVLESGKRPEVPACSGADGRLVDWYRHTFGSAVRHGIIDDRWFSSREAWHVEAYRTFPGKLVDYYQNINAAERALTREPERRMLASEGGRQKWYGGVFESAVKLGLVPADDAGNENP